jgi:RES domain-containing protein
MIVYRLSRQKYKDELSGFGASLNGQRWNSKGTEVVYTAQTRALANSEVAVHISLGILPSDYFMVEVFIPDIVDILEIKVEGLPEGWNYLPSTPDSQFVGDNLVKENKFAVLKVPSVVVKGEFNFVLNPKHKDFSLIKILSSEPFPFDRRFFKK